VYECGSEETCDPIRFHKDGKRAYLVTDKGEVDKSRLVLLDAATGNVEVVESDPDAQVDFGGAIFSESTNDLIATTYTGDRERIYPKDPTFAADVKKIRAALPTGDLFFRTPSKDDRVWIVKTIVDNDNGPNYLYDRATGKIELLYRPYPNIPIEHMAPMKAVRYKARDGVEISAYLTLPKGVAAKNLPVVINPHGGPWGRDSWGFNGEVQFLANRGYAVLQPNFRGSAGFGKKFLNLGNDQWGTGTMQHDLTDGVKWLVAQGIADPKRIAIMGGSYGGYATLAGVAFTPELYAAGVSIVGPSSITTLLQSIPPYWEPIRKMFAVRVGDLEDPKDMERMRAQSPLYSADKIKAPLLVIQGANDPRVKKAESDQIVVAMRDRGRPVEYLVAPDEGHGFAGRMNNLATYAKVEEFLAKHLGGRNQKEVRPEIRDRLKELTVDVAGVTAAK
jgi:dipeptidyl aminopeptidase/acylaminoacyl peptidase